MHLSLLNGFFYVFIIHQLNVGLCLVNFMNGTNFTNWLEDDWLEIRFLIEKKFIFNQQRHENIRLRTRTNEWSLELSAGNQTHMNRFWTELHLFLDRRTNLNNSIQGHWKNQCYEPIISPITNDSTFSVPELFEMDQRIANYFVNDGFFRTFNYIKCTIYERRLEPMIYIQMDIYLVTNREFQSLIYIEMPEETQTILSNLQARFYLHSDQAKLKYNFNASNINSQLNPTNGLAYMIKLYDPTVHRTSSSVILSESLMVILFNLFIFQCYHVVN